VSFTACILGSFTLTRNFGGMKPKTWVSTSYTSVQRILPINDVARSAWLLFPKWPVPRKPNIWPPAELDEC